MYSAMAIGAERDQIAFLVVTPVGLEMWCTSTIAQPGPPPEPQKRIVKKRETFHLPVDLMNEIRDTVVALGGTLSGFVEEALRDYLANIRRDWNDGRRLPRRRSEVKRGRPLKHR